ncbi:MAG TPA: glycosyltransferase family 4 protein [Terriglobia bacterium]|nr:glycosyltransferase family 4 protein [Terriglobia bacterium]
MKVLQLISSGGYYGAENMLLNLIGSSPQTISENLLAVFYNRHAPNLELYERAIARGVTAKTVHCGGRFDWRGVQAIRQIVRAHRIDVVHTHGYKADLYGYLAARREGRPVVATCHNWLAGGTKLAFYNFLDRIVLRRFDALGAVSDVIAEKLVSFGVQRERIRVIANGIDIRAFASASAATPDPTRAPGEHILGIIGRLDLQKGFEYLLRAVANLRSSFPGLSLLIVGEGPDRGKIEELVSHHGLTGHVMMTGRQTDMPKIYNSFDIFVLPSLNEGLPMTLLEAMAAGKAIIATRVGAVPQVVTDGVTGLLVEPGDVTSLKGAISQLLYDPDRCRQLGRNAQAHVMEHYSAAAMAQKYHEMYAQVLARRGGPKILQAPVAYEPGSAEPLSSQNPAKSESPTQTLTS